MTTRIKQTSADWVTDELRTLILRGIIRPGERINIKQLESRFGVSHIPIREATRKLESEGLITLLAQHGATAAHVSEQEISDIYDLRGILEPVVAQRAARNASDSDRTAVIEAGVHLARAEERDDSDEFYEAHSALHGALLAPGSNREIDRVLRHLKRASERYIRLTHITVGTQAHDQHDLMVTAFVKGDGDEMMRLLAAHLAMTEEAFRLVFNNGDLAHLGMQGTGEPTAVDGRKGFV